jgi:putative cardiolipin synthase
MGSVETENPSPRAVHPRPRGIKFPIGGRVAICLPDLAAWLAVTAVSIAVSIALGGCVTLDRDTPRTPSSALGEAETTSTTLGQAWATMAPADPELSAFRLLPASLEAFAARVALIDAAERTLDLQYYIFHADETGLFLIDRLMAAADRGVRVRILVDDMYTHGIEKGLAAFDAHPNIELRIFNPWSQRSGSLVRGLEFIASPRLNHRMHNKMFIADGSVAILGGRNLADEYFHLNPEFEYRDLDVAAVGPIVREANGLFDEFWNCSDAIPVTGFKPRPDVDAMLKEGTARLLLHREHMKTTAYADAVRATEFVQQLKTKSLEWVFARGHVLGDSPVKAKGGDAARQAPTLADQMRDDFFAARQELLISSPYFVPGKNATRRLSELVSAGVDVRILTNSLAANDVKIAHANYAKYRKSLVRGGVDVFELRRRGASAAEQSKRAQRGYGSVDASVHAKAFVIDRQRVFIGSLNLDPRSVAINTEVGVLIDSPELATSVAGSMTRLMSPEWSYRLAVSSDGDLIWIGHDADGREIRFTTDPDTSWWDRFKAGFLGLLPLESQS